MTSGASLRCRARPRPAADARAHMGGNVRGVMLIVCLMFLLVISLTAAVTVRRAASSDAVAGNARTHTLALQAAEAGLLHCERLFAAFAADPAQGLAPAAAPAGAGEPFLWEGLGNWDGPSAQGKARRVPFGDSESGGAQAYFRRSPECMAQYYAAGRTATAVVTARGFGPEVAPQGGGQAAPRGTEVWLQSVMTVPADGRPASRAWRQIFPRTQ